MIRKVTITDLDAIATIYQHIHEAEQRGEVTIGWDPNIYPVRATATEALQRNDLFVMEIEGEVVATAIINQIQPLGYTKGNWRYPASDEEVMVLHTLVVEPSCKHRGLGKAFIAYYEQYAKEQHCTVLRLDTQSKNSIPIKMYPKLGYRIADTVSCDFNGLAVNELVLFEKQQRQR